MFRGAAPGTPRRSCRCTGRRRRGGLRRRRRCGRWPGRHQSSGYRRGIRLRPGPRPGIWERALRPKRRGSCRGIRQAANPQCRTGVGGIYQRRIRQSRISRSPVGSASAWRRDWIEWRCAGSAVPWSVARCCEQRFEVEIEQIRTSRRLHLVVLTARFWVEKAGIDRLISMR